MMRRRTAALRASAGPTCRRVAAQAAPEIEVRSSSGVWAGGRCDADSEIALAVVSAVSGAPDAAAVSHHGPRFARRELRELGANPRGVRNATNVNTTAHNAGGTVDE